LTPFVKLADQLGSFAGQLTETSLKGIRIEYEGDVAELNTRALTAVVLSGVLKPLLQSVNMVSAPAVAKERGIQIEETRREQQGAYENYIRVTLVTERQERSVAGTVFGDAKPRIIQIKGINMEAELGANMLYITNQDKPGFIGRLGSLLGKHELNIATFNLGRKEAGQDAIALIEIDGVISDAVISEIEALEGVVQAKAMLFTV
jgi:D-3-phosphoglycerate dehydrogenase